MFTFIYSTDDLGNEKNIEVIKQGANDVYNSVSTQSNSANIGAWIFAACILSVVIATVIVSIWYIDKSRLMSGSILYKLSFGKLNTNNITGVRLFIFVCLLVTSIVLIISSFAYILIFKILIVIFNYL